MNTTQARARLAKLEAEAAKTKRKKRVENVALGKAMQQAYGGKYEPIYTNPEHSAQFMAELEKVYGG